MRVEYNSVGVTDVSRYPWTVVAIGGRSSQYALSNVSHPSGHGLTGETPLSSARKHEARRLVDGYLLRMYRISCVPLCRSKRKGT